MIVIPYDELNMDALPIEALITRPGVETTIFPVITPVGGGVRPRFVTFGEELLVDVVAEVRGRRFCVWWLVPGPGMARSIYLNPSSFGQPIHEETVARRLFPELNLYAYSVETHE